MATTTPVRPKVPLWKLVGGAAIHCVVPSYLLGLGVDGWHFATHAGGGVAAWLAQVPGVSGWFLGIYATLGLGATGLAALVPARRDAAPALVAADHLRTAVTQGRGAFGGAVDEALNRIAALRPDAADPAVAPMLRDLAAMVSAGRAALGKGDDARICAMTAGAIDHIAREIEAHAGLGAQEAREKVQVLAGYVAQRYGPDEI